MSPLNALINALHLHNNVFCFSEMNMAEIAATVGNFVVCFFPMEGQPTLGVLRFAVSLIVFFVFIMHDAVTGDGILVFSCHPKTDDGHEERCFSKYTTEMNPLMRLHHFLLVTALILAGLWIAMIRYSSIHFKKVRGEFPDTRKRLGQEFFKWFIGHAVAEAVVIFVIFVLFLCTQKIRVVDGYNCNHQIASGVICMDKHRFEKRFFNVLFILWMLFTFFLCIGTFIHVQRNQDNYVKELMLVLDTTVNEAEKKV